jgi:hypothetical protein
MIPQKYILKPGAKLKPKRFDANDPFVKEVIESVKRAQEELERFNRYDPKQMEKVINI